MYICIYVKEMKCFVQPGGVGRPSALSQPPATYGPRPRVNPRLTRVNPRGPVPASCYLWPSAEG